MGASVRAFAQSVYRAGFRPVAFDLFGDRDLKTIAECTVLPKSRYPQGFREFATRLCGREWAYTGGLENYPDLLRFLAANSTMLGNEGRRDATLADIVEKMECPRFSRTQDGVPTDGTWLAKPLRGSGGREIVEWRGQPLRAGDWFWQQRIEGDSYSAVFVADRRIAELFGITKQLVGVAFCNAPMFGYCGSVIVDLDSHLRASILRIGKSVAHEMRLRGVFGIDLIVDRDGKPWPIEVNPRYPASAELFERQSGVSIFGLHRHCFDADDEKAECPLLDVSDLFGEKGEHPLLGKAILYAPFACVVADDNWGETTAAACEVTLADLPHGGSNFETGEPLITVIAEAQSEFALMRKLRSACQLLSASLNARSAAGQPDKS